MSPMQAAVAEVVATRGVPGAPNPCQIAKKYGVNRGNLSTACKRLGIELGALRQTDIDARNAKIVELVRSGVTVSEACARHGVDPSLANKRNAKGTLLGNLLDGIVEDARRQAQAERKRMLDEIERIIDQGVSVSEAARRVGMNIKTAHKALARRPAELAAA